MQRRKMPNNNGGKGNGVNTPMFPGMQKGDKTIEQVQNYIKEQVRRKGFKFSGGTSATDFKIDIPGNGRYFYGIAFLNGFDAVCTLIVNNEIVMQGVDVGFILFGKTEQDYFAVNRPLSGSDSITLTITGGAGYTNQPFLVIYK